MIGSAGSTTKDPMTGLLRIGIHERPHGRRPLLLAVLLVGLLTTMFGHGVARSAPACSQSQQILKAGSWTLIRPPEHEYGFKDRRFRDYAVDPRDSNRILIWQNTQVFLTEDGGCRWKLVYELPAPYVANPLYPTLGAERFTNTGGQPVRDAGIGKDGRLFVLGLAMPDNVVRLSVSADSGAHWDDFAIDTLGEPWQLPQMLSLAPEDPDTLYVSYLSESTERRGDNSVARFVQGENGEPDSDGLLMSSDGGRSWTVTYEAPTDPSLTARRDRPSRWDLPPVVDPLSSKELWLVGSDAGGFQPIACVPPLPLFCGEELQYGLFHSLDAGASWERVEFPRDYDISRDSGSMGQVSVVHVPRRPARLAISGRSSGAANSGRFLFESQDGGKSWQARPHPMQAAAFPPRHRVMGRARSSDVYLLGEIERYSREWHNEVGTYDEPRVENLWRLDARTGAYQDLNPGALFGNQKYQFSGLQASGRSVFFIVNLGGTDDPYFLIRL